MAARPRQLGFGLDASASSSSSSSGTSAPAAARSLLSLEVAASEPAYQSDEERGYQYDDDDDEEASDTASSPLRAASPAAPPPDDDESDTASSPALAPSPPAPPPDDASDSASEHAASPAAASPLNTAPPLPVPLEKESERASPPVLDAHISDGASPAATSAPASPADLAASSDLPHSHSSPLSSDSEMPSLIRTLGRRQSRTDDAESDAGYGAGGGTTTLRRQIGLPFSSSRGGGGGGSVTASSSSRRIKPVVLEEKSTPEYAVASSAARGGWEAQPRSLLLEEPLWPAGDAAEYSIGRSLNLTAASSKKRLPNGMPAPPPVEEYDIFGGRVVTGGQLDDEYPYDDDEEEAPRRYFEEEEEEEEEDEDLDEPAPTTDHELPALPVEASESPESSLDRSDEESEDEAVVAPVPVLAAPKTPPYPMRRHPSSELHDIAEESETPACNTPLPDSDEGEHDEGEEDEEDEDSEHAASAAAAAAYHQLPATPTVEHTVESIAIQHGWAKEPLAVPAPPAPAPSASSSALPAAAQRLAAPLPAREEQPVAMPLPAKLAAAPSSQDDDEEWESDDGADDEDALATIGAALTTLNAKRDGVASPEPEAQLEAEAALDDGSWETDDEPPSRPLPVREAGRGSGSGIAVAKRMSIHRVRAVRVGAKQPQRSISMRKASSSRGSRSSSGSSNASASVKSALEAPQVPDKAPLALVIPEPAAPEPESSRTSPKVSSPETAKSSSSQEYASTSPQLLPSRNVASAPSPAIAAFAAFQQPAQAKQASASMAKSNDADARAGSSPEPDFPGAFGAPPARLKAAPAKPPTITAPRAWPMPPFLAARAAALAKKSAAAAPPPVPAKEPSSLPAPAAAVAPVAIPEPSSRDIQAAGWRTARRVSDSSASSHEYHDLSSSAEEPKPSPLLIPAPAAAASATHLSGAVSPLYASFGPSSPILVLQPTTSRQSTAAAAEATSADVTPSMALKAAAMAGWTSEPDEPTRDSATQRSMSSTQEESLASSRSETRLRNAGLVQRSNAARERTAESAERARELVRSAASRSAAAGQLFSATPALRSNESVDQLGAEHITFESAAVATDNLASSLVMPKTPEPEPAPAAPVEQRAAALSSPPRPPRTRAGSGSTHLAAPVPSDYGSKSARRMSTGSATSPRPPRPPRSASRETRVSQASGSGADDDAEGAELRARLSPQERMRRLRQRAQSEQASLDGSARSRLAPAQEQEEHEVEHYYRSAPLFQSQQASVEAPFTSLSPDASELPADDARDSLSDLELEERRPRATLPSLSLKKVKALGGISLGRKSAKAASAKPAAEPVRPASSRTAPLRGAKSFDVASLDGQSIASRSPRHEEHDPERSSLRGSTKGSVRGSMRGSVRRTRGRRSDSMSVIMASALEAQRQVGSQYQSSSVDDGTASLKGPQRDESRRQSTDRRSTQDETASLSSRMRTSKSAPSIGTKDSSRSISAENGASSSRTPATPEVETSAPTSANSISLSSPSNVLSRLPPLEDQHDEELDSLPPVEKYVALAGVLAEMLGPGGKARVQTLANEGVRLQREQRARELEVERLEECIAALIPDDLDRQAIRDLHVAFSTKVPRDYSKRSISTSTVDKERIAELEDKLSTMEDHVTSQKTRLHQLSEVRPRLAAQLELERKRFEKMRRVENTLRRLRPEVFQTLGAEASSSAADADGVQSLAKRSTASLSGYVSDSGARGEKSLEFYGEESEHALGLRTAVAAQREAMDVLKKHEQDCYSLLLLAETVLRNLVADIIDIALILDSPSVRPDDEEARAHHRRLRFSRSAHSADKRAIADADRAELDGSGEDITDEFERVCFLRRKVESRVSELEDQLRRVSDYYAHAMDAELARRALPGSSAKVRAPPSAWRGRDAFGSAYLPSRNSSHDSLVSARGAADDELPSPDDAKDGHFATAPNSPSQEQGALLVVAPPEAVPQAIALMLRLLASLRLLSVPHTTPQQLRRSAFRLSQWSQRAHATLPQLEDAREALDLVIVHAEETSEKLAEACVRRMKVADAQRRAFWTASAQAALSNMVFSG